MRWSLKPVLAIFLRLLPYVTAEVVAAPLLPKRSVGSATHGFDHLEQKNKTVALKNSLDKE
jgi:hypothetical protein